MALTSPEEFQSNAQKLHTGDVADAEVGRAGGSGTAFGAVVGAALRA